MSTASLSMHLPPQKGQNSSALMRNSFWYKTLFNQDRKDLYEYTRGDIAEKVLLPNAKLLDSKDADFKHNEKTWGKGESRKEPKSIVDLGPYLLGGVGIPEKYGGYEQWSGVVDMVVLQQNLAYGYPSAAAFMDGQGLFTTAMMLGGNESQKLAFLPKIASGEIIGCYALTDIESGSDVGSMKSLHYAFDAGAEKYTLNGAKMFITNGPIADMAVVFAKNEGNEAKYKNITSFAVPSYAIGGFGFTSDPPLDKIGWRASPTSIIRLTDCELGKEAIVGVEGKGFQVALHTLNYGRVKVAAEALGIMEWYFDRALDYVQQRKAYGSGTLKEKDMVRAHLASIAGIIEHTRNAVYSTAFKVENTTPNGEVNSFMVEASLVKAFAADNLEKVAKIAVEIFGGNGVMKDYEVGHRLGDVKIYQFIEGTRDPMMIAIGNLLAEI